MKIRLLLIRHGKTVLADKGIYYGATDVALSEEGISELEEFKRLNLYPDADIYFTSGLTRANKTLGIIKGNVGYSTIPSLKEYNFGDFELHTHDELVSNSEYIAWMEDKTGDVFCTNGECRSEFIKRMSEGILELFVQAQKNNAQTVLTVTHGGIISNFITAYYDSSLSYYDAMPKCGHGVDTVMECDGNSFKVLKLSYI